MAFLNQEPGSDVVSQAIARGAVISAVNLSEVVAKIADAGTSEAIIRSALSRLNIDIIPFDAELAYLAGLLRPLTRQAGLSFGDRACLAVAQHLSAEALTTDRTWADLRVEVVIRVLR
jgi:PIN domain nuclease of toxin-antitoxin system